MADNYKMSDNYLHSEVTERIVKGFYRVYNLLGYGFLEKVYRNSLLLELKNLELECAPLYPIDVFYNNHKVGYYIADLVINQCVIVEVKAAESLHPAHEAQLINYLKATNIEVGLLLNFGLKPQLKRKVFSAQHKILKNHNNHKNPWSPHA
jgi:GxxExxY protein